MVFEANEGLSTLLDFKHRRFLRAPRGKNGGTANRTGANGEDLVLRVPVGTLVQDRSGGSRLADLRTHGQRWIAARGGRGGRGNSSFVSSIRRSPDFAQVGEPGQVRELRLTLKLMADVGIVGFPNSGKSTFISCVSNARPKIADYPFTTLVPHLGMVRAGEASFVVADIPGLIEGASEGAGLGHRFLRHVERTSLFLFMLDCGPEHPSPLDALRILETELQRHDARLVDRKRVVALNKVDLPEVEAEVSAVRAALEARGIPFVPISCVTRAGIDDLVWLLARQLGREG